jgi:hypothetical protein
MLWQALAYKGWLETRWRLLFGLGWQALFLVQFHMVGVKAQGGVRGVMGMAWVLVAMIPLMLAGAGIATQPAFQAVKGLHGSMYFTLSLPVSRLRLIAVRAAVGWLETCVVLGVVSLGIWTSPLLRAAPPLEAIEHIVATIVCASALYSITMLLSTFLDDMWRIWGSMIAYTALWWLSTHTPLPASLNIFRALGEGSPLASHTMPWSAMAFSLSLAAILFFAALKVVQAREY